MSLSPAHPVAAPAGEPQAIGVMIVDDSAVVRGLVSRWIDEDPALAVVGKFSNGRQAVDGIDKCIPDVVVLDIEMPVMDGMTALPLLLERIPGVKVIVASTLTRRNAEIGLRALSLGAVDYVPKPEGNSGITRSSTFRDELLGKVRALGGAHPARPVQRAGQLQPAASAAGEPVPAPALRPFSRTRPRVLAIGSSTGGPKMLVALLREIGPVISRLPVLVAQHMPPTFTAILAAHLGREAGCIGKEAADGEPLRPGTIYVAPGGRHLAVAENSGTVVLRVYDGPEVNFCKPSVDPLFESVAGVFGPSALGLVLTGMGHDGADGALGIADAGGSVIAQDAATSVVWGMPGSAVAAGACVAILPAGEIADKVMQLMQGAAP